MLAAAALEVENDSKPAGPKGKKAKKKKKDDDWYVANILKITFGCTGLL